MRIARAWPLAALLLVALGGCNPRWPAQAAEARQRADRAVAEGRGAEAEAGYLESLRYDPYQPAVHFALARRLESAAGGLDRAFVHWRACAELLDPAAPMRLVAEERAGTLQEIIAGRLEDPVDALDDLLWAARRSNAWLFTRRLDGSFVRALAAEKRDPRMEMEGWAAGYAWGAVEIEARDVTRAAARVRAAVRREGAPTVAFDFRFVPQAGGTWLLAECTAVEASGT